MSGKRKKGSAEAAPRAYGRLTEARAGHGPEDAGAQGLVQGDRRGELGRSPSTVSAEVASHRFVTAPKPEARRARGRRHRPVVGLPALAAWPRCCNGCGRYRAMGCKRRPHVFYEARAAAVRRLGPRLVQARDRRRRARRGGQAGGDKGLPAPGALPEQMAARNGGPVDLSPSTIYRWVSAGYDGMTNMELRRKVGYRPRKRAAGRAATRHSARRSHAAFLALGEDVCAAAWEMDTVEGAREDSACLLTLLHRPSRLQLALLLEAKDSASVEAALEGVRSVLGDDGMGEGLPRRAHRQRRGVLRRGGDRGAARRGARRDEAVLLRPAPQRPEGRLRAKPRRDKEAAAQGRRNQVRPARPGGLALAMSHANSEPAARSASRRPRAPSGRCSGEDAAALLDAYGVGDVPLGDLDLTPGAHREGARREGRCPAGLAWKKKRNRRTDRPAESGEEVPGGGRSMATGPIETHLHRSFNWGNAAPGPRGGASGAFG